MHANSRHALEFKAPRVLHLGAKSPATRADSVSSDIYSGRGSHRADCSATNEAGRTAKDHANESYYARGQVYLVSVTEIDTHPQTPSAAAACAHVKMHGRPRDN